MKIFVVYDTKYGNTKIVAEKIVEGLMDAEEIETTISDVEEVNLEKAVECDAILIGSPNHFGRPARTIKKFIDKLGKINLKAEWFAVFDTYLGGHFEKAVKKMEKRINEKIPKLKQIAPGLSIKVQGVKGPIAEGELTKCKDFGRKIANKLRKRQNGN